jgi:uncharacterized membrane protein
VLPLWISVLLMVKALSGVRQLIHPLAKAIPESFIHPDVVAFGALLATCFMAGTLMRTRLGQSATEAIEEGVLCRIPGYRLIRDIFRRLTGQERDETWAVALVEIEDALVPAFVVEELPDGRYSVFVPSVPTPAAGAVYVLPRERVHIVNVPFTQAVRCITKWGSGTGALVEAMKAQA